MATQFKIEEELNTLMLHEPAASYYGVSIPSQFSFREFLEDKMMLIAAIRAGIPWSLFELIQQITPFSEQDWADFLDLSTKSLQRYKQDGKSFKSIHSEKIVELAEVTEMGKDVFGGLEKFKLWLNTPNFALGKFRPKELLKDSYGKELIMIELHNINHGILA